jgi:integrase
MGHSDLDPVVDERQPWNSGKNAAPKRPLKARDIWAIRFCLDEHKRLRDRALFDLAIDSKLRGCDLVKLRIDALVSGGSFRDRTTVIQQKTGRPVQFEIMPEARNSLETWLRRRGGTIADFVFPSRIDYLADVESGPAGSANAQVKSATIGKDAGLGERCHLLDCEFVTRTRTWLS